MKNPNADAIIDKIRDIRADNNHLWLDLLRLAYKYDETLTRDIITNIGKNDKEITECLGKL